MSYRIFITIAVLSATTLYALQSADAVSLEKAWKASPQDPHSQYSYAMVAPCSLSVALFTVISTNSKAPDSLRAKAYRQLGDYSFVHSAFKTAAAKYAQANALSANAEYVFLQARAFAALGDTAVWVCLQKLSADSSAEFTGKAKVLEASVLMKENEYDSAFKVLSHLGTGDTAKPFYVEALAMKRECALRTGRNSEASALAQKLSPVETTLLEGNRLHHMPVSVAAGGQRQNSAEQQDADSEEFTLQVGAFSSVDNATALQKKLEKSFNDVTVLPATMAETVVYRVRVGSFKTKYEADVFGNDSLASAGYNFRSVVK